MQLIAPETQELFLFFVQNKYIEYNPVFVCVIWSYNMHTDAIRNELTF